MDQQNKRIVSEATSSIEVIGNWFCFCIAWERGRGARVPGCQGARVQIGIGNRAWLVRVGGVYWVTRFALLFGFAAHSSSWLSSVCVRARVCVCICVCGCVGVIFAEIFAWQCIRGEYCGFLICIPQVPSAPLLPSIWVTFRHTLIEFAAHSRCCKGVRLHYDCS